MKIKLAIILIALIVLAVALVKGTQGVNGFFETHYLAFNQVMNIEIKPPFEIKAREPKVVQVLMDYPDAIDTPIEKYICDKWGPYDCKVALAVASAESGLREDALNINTNGTLDLGIFQINSVHFKKAGCTLKDLVVAEKNVDCAYQIWKDQKWEPWVAWKNGSYLLKI